MKIFTLMSEIAKKFKISAKRVMIPHWRAKNAWGDLVFMKCETVWDTNQGSLNGLQPLRRYRKNISP